MSHQRNRTEGLHVLEFDLGVDRYAVDISSVDEIVDREELTTIPNTPRHVEGVMDLRGETTTIVNPRRIFDVETGDGERGQRIVVFEDLADDEDRTIGWLVDEVYQVNRVDLDHLDNDVAEGAVEGVIRRDDEFVIWVAPEKVEV
jgi:purine-binding chemotaxis protein CheW